MLGIAVIAFIGLSILMIMTGFWAYHELSGPQIFQRTLPSQHRRHMPMKHKGQKGYINLFAKLVTNEQKTVKIRAPRSWTGGQLKVPWGW